MRFHALLLRNPCESDAFNVSCLKKSGNMCTKPGMMEEKTEIMGGKKWRHGVLETWSTILDSWKIHGGFCPKKLRLKNRLSAVNINKLMC
jgi:hypothetical protein